jgi:tripartite-type tricarboxylate transporter receptor subunit TctC
MTYTNKATTQGGFSQPYSRRTFSAMLATLPLIGTGARAQAKFPEKPINLVVPYGPGTGTDALGRRLASVMPSLLGQPMVVDNKAGASAQIGTQAVTRSAPDGYTLLLGTDQVVCSTRCCSRACPTTPRVT